MTAPHAAMSIVGALILIAAMYVWMIRSNRRHHRRMQRRRQEWNAGTPADEANFSLGSDLTASVMADHEVNLR